MTERRNLIELVTLYELEPELRDLYTEGVYDSNLFKWYLRCRDIDAQVYPIDLIEIPTTVACQYSSGEGNRGRVIALANYMAAKCKNPPLHVVALADRDFDILLRVQVPNSPNLVFTDFSCAEMLLWNEKSIDRLLSLSLGVVDLVGKDILSCLEPVARQLSLLRAASISLGWGLSWICPSKYIKVSQAALVFDEASFLQSYLCNGGRGKELDVFKAKLCELRNSAPSDSREFVRGHDFTFLLALVVGPHVSKNAKKLLHDDTFPRLLKSCIDLNEMDHALFVSRLVAKLR